MTTKTGPQHRLLGMELYFEDVSRARDFYRDILGMLVEEEQAAHHTKLALQGGFLCLERKGAENYPSQDKAVVFIEVADLRSFVGSVVSERFVRVELGASPRWAVLHDPEGHNVVCIEAANEIKGLGHGDSAAVALRKRDS
jgi:catechol 2,3-dioxygenase-like lactoylglutathione lyase family enzyme